MATPHKDIKKIGILSETTLIDRIEYDITRLKYLTYKMASERVRVCVRACAVEIKSEMLRASMMYAFGRAYGLPYKGLFNTVYRARKHSW